MGPSCPTRRAAGTDGNGIDKLVLPRWLCVCFYHHPTQRHASTIGCPGIIIRYI